MKVHELLRGSRRDAGDRYDPSEDPEYVGYLLHAATDAAINGALTHGVDVPVGAATGVNKRLLAANYAQDNLLEDRRAHAEFMTLRSGDREFPSVKPDTITVTLEPCKSCQDFLATIPAIRTVAFLLPLSEAAERGITRHKPETIFDRAGREGLPYDIVQMEDIRLADIGRYLLDVTMRDIESETTCVDKEKLMELVG